MAMKQPAIGLSIPLLKPDIHDADSVIDPEGPQPRVQHDRDRQNPH